MASRGRRGIMGWISRCGGAGEPSARRVERYIQTAFEQAASAKALRLVRAQFGSTPRA